MFEAIVIASAALGLVFLGYAVYPWVAASFQVGVDLSRALDKYLEEDKKDG